MPANQHLLLHGLRMLVLAIALVLAPANTETCEYSAAETPVLVLALARDFGPNARRSAPVEVPRAARAAIEPTRLWDNTPLGRLVN
ncbi:MAG TPA: hypothetical protein VKP30_25585, partial [Polyangiaceae bacterium]|nr:hypothetical protein [Polyangiaceae bacterium]